MKSDGKPAGSEHTTGDVAPECHHGEGHFPGGEEQPCLLPGPLELDRAAALFRALGDASRLKLLSHLAQREHCVSELASVFEEGLSTISQRLRLLRTEGLVSRRRDGKHIYYGLADGHVQELIRNALEHSEEVHGISEPKAGESTAN